MFHRDAGGVESLPVVLVLSVTLGVMALGLGMSSLSQTRELLEDQRALESFDVLVEQARAISFGGLGSERRFDLDLPGSKILVDGRLVQLVIDDEVRRGEVLPLPILRPHEGNLELRSGSYTLELSRAVSSSGEVMGGEFFLELGRV